MPRRARNRSKVQPKKLPHLFGIGVLMGTADLVPGVSGGTVAFLMGIYDELIESIRRVTGVTLKQFAAGNITAALQSIPFSFLLPLGIGIVGAVFAFAPGLTFLLEEFPVFLYSIFFGLIISSIVIVSKRVDVWGKNEVAALLLGSLFVFLIIGLTPNELSATPFVFFLTGVIAFCAMILPGISGSLIMLILGSYGAVLAAVSDRDIGLLLFLVLGGALGLGVFSRILHAALRSYHTVTIALLIGFMIGSLRKVWPWKETIDPGEIGAEYLQANVLPSLGAEAIVAFTLMLLSFILVLQLGKKGVIRDHKTEDLPLLLHTNNNTPTSNIKKGTRATKKK